MGHVFEESKGGNVSKWQSISISTHLLMISVGLLVYVAQTWIVYIMNSLILGCDGQTTNCYEEYSCATDTISGVTGAYLWGYRSCHSCSVTSTCTARCSGSYSCYEASNVAETTATTAGCAPECYGMFSCANVVNVDSAASIVCHGEKSCMQSSIVSYGTEWNSYLGCCGLASCSYSTIQIKSDATFSGLFAARNSDIYSRDSSVVVDFEGSQSGYDCTVYCNVDDTCEIGCYGDACNNLNLVSVGGTFTINCYYDAQKSNICSDGKEISSFIYEFELPPSLLNNHFSIIEDLDDENGYNPCNYSDSFRAAINCGDYRDTGDTDCYLLSVTLTNNASFCCTGYESCEGTTIATQNISGLETSDVINRTGIRCDGYYACQSASLTSLENGGDIYVTGYLSGEHATIETTTGEYDVYCNGFFSCSNSQILYARDVYCVASYGCEDATFGSGTGIVGNIYCYGVSSCEHSTILNVYGNVYCSAGLTSCSESSISSVNYTVFGMGYRALSQSTIDDIGEGVISFGYQSSYGAIIDNVPSFYCDGTYCFENGIITTVNSIKTNGTDSLKSSTISSDLSINGKSDTVFMLRIYSNNTESFTVTCGDGDSCYIGCYNTGSCTNMTLTCTDANECFIDCGSDIGTDCPVIIDGNYTKWVTMAPTSPTSIPSSVPTSTTAIPTAGPTNSPTGTTAFPTSSPTNVTGDPTKMPTNLPQPSTIPTSIPTDIPTAIPSEMPTDKPTQRPTNTPTVDPTDKPTDTPTGAPNTTTESAGSTQSSESTTSIQSTIAAGSQESSLNFNVSTVIIVFMVIVSVCLVCGCWVVAYLVFKSKSHSEKIGEAIVNNNDGMVSNYLKNKNQRNNGQNNGTRTFALSQSTISMSNQSSGLNSPSGDEGSKITSDNGERDVSHSDSVDRLFNDQETNYSYATRQKSRTSNLNVNESNDNLVHGDINDSNHDYNVSDMPEIPDNMRNSLVLALRAEGQDNDQNNNDDEKNETDDKLPKAGKKTKLNFSQSSEVVADGAIGVTGGAKPAKATSARNVNALALVEDNTNTGTRGHGNGDLGGLDESKYEKWTKNDVLLWLKINLMDNGMTQKETKSFLKEFSSKRITGGSLHVFKTVDKNDQMFNQLKNEFSYQNQAFGIWMVIKACIDNLGQSQETPQGAENML